MVQTVENEPVGRPGGVLLVHALRHRAVTLLAVAVSAAVAVLLLVLMAPSRYDAIAIVGFSPSGDGPAAADLVQLAAAQSAEAAGGQRLLAAAEEATGAPSGTLEAGDVHAELIPDTAMVQMVVSDGDPQVAADLADALAAAVVSSADANRLQAELVREAEVPASPAAPARGLYAAAGVLAGIGLGLCVVLGLEAWRPRVRSASHLSLILQAPTVAELAPPASHGAPVREMRRAQLRLSQLRTRAGEDRGSVGLGDGLAVAGAGRVTQRTLAWVGAGLAGALTKAGHVMTISDPGSDTPRWLAPPAPDGTVWVLPAEHAARDAQRPAAAPCLHRAIVVVEQNEPVPAIDRVRQDLEAAGIELVAGILIRGKSTQRQEAQGQASDLVPHEAGEFPSQGAARLSGQEVVEGVGSEREQDAKKAPVVAAVPQVRAGGIGAARAGVGRHVG